MKLSPRRLDAFLILPLGASLLMIGEAAKERAVTLNFTAWEQAAILGAGTLVLVFLVIRATAFDRRCSEDYIFQLMANAALVAMGCMALVNVIWMLAMKFYAIPQLTGQNITGIAILAWILAYYWYRLRGFQK
ncbi:MAG: hypothetical protein APF78_09945 [Sphingomonadales bacterium BRH_c3]|nr:MAG: hypothetical protein APF78_09945 [Sphingomonadales bacterium BRH_c3]